MSERRRPRPALDQVREALRDHDERTEDDAPAPAEGDAGREPGVAVARIDLSAGERFQRLRQELGVTAFGLNVIRLAPGQRGRIHSHERQEEVYVVLEGTLTLVVDREPHTLERLEAARVAPGMRRRLLNAGSEPLALLAIGGAAPHEGRDGVAFASWEDTEGAPPQDVPLPEDLAPGATPE
jgi:mannose-6-phosphate isomerase-like protein (cupin superfamily)